MTVSKVNLKLQLGKVLPSAAPAQIMEALSSVNISHGDSGPSTFQLTFNADRTAKFSNDYPVVSSPLLRATNRVIISVELDSTETVLMDGFITHTELSYAEEQGNASYTVTGEDVSVMMSLFERSTEYPGLGDDLIVGVVLAKYMALGIVPEIVPNPKSPVSDPLDEVPQQNCNDRDYISSLAQQNGYVFRVRPFLNKVNKAYWGPIVQIGVPQKPLNVNLGGASNVEHIQFSYDALAPTLVHGMLQDGEPLEEDMPVITVDAVRLQPMAEHSGLVRNQPFVKNAAFQDSRLNFVRGMLEAQVTTDRSTDNVVSAQGTVDTIRYGAVIQSPGVIPVRGIGHSYDGNYYVSNISHTIQDGQYKQDFTIQREGTGSTISNVGDLF